MSKYDKLVGKLKGSRPGKETVDAMREGARAILSLEACNTELEESTHYANGVADLAMKHRDEAELKITESKAVVNLVLSYMDRMNDDTEPADGILEDFTRDIEPLLTKYTGEQS